MKKILTSLLMAIAVFCMAAPTTNKADKKDRKTVTATSKTGDQKDGANESPKKVLSAEEKKEKRERAIMERKNEIWNSSNGGGRISYH